MNNPAITCADDQHDWITCQHDPANQSCSHCFNTRPTPRDDLLVLVKSLRLGFDKVSIERDHLRVFKELVHARLDEMGVPKDPPALLAETDACRIGKRLRWLKDQRDAALHANERDRVRLVVHLDELHKAMQSWRWIPDGETQNAEADGTLSEEVNRSYRAIEAALDPLWAMARDLTNSPGSAGRGAGVKAGTALAMQDKSVVTDQMVERALAAAHPGSHPIGDDALDYAYRAQMRAALEAVM